MEFSKRELAVLLLALDELPGKMKSDEIRLLSLRIREELAKPLPTGHLTKISLTATEASPERRITGQIIDMRIRQTLKYLGMEIISIEIGK